MNKQIEEFETALSDIGEYSKYSKEYYCMWLLWQQAQKVAVPDTHILVSHEDLLNLTIEINVVDLATHTENKTNEIREMWRDIATKLMYLWCGDKDITEVQEKSNDKL